MKKDTRKPELREVEIKIEVDEYPNLDWLETELSEDKKEIIKSDQYTNEDLKTDRKNTLKYIEQDKQRLRDYNKGKWQMLGISAVATIYLPTNFINDKGEYTDWKIQKIDSGGLYGIESDSEEGYIKETGSDQCDELKHYLELLQIDLTNFETLKNKALETIKDY